MDIVVGNTFLRAGPQSRRKLIETLGTYVTHNGFLNLIRQLDPQDKRGAHTTHICLQLAQFNSNSHLWDQVELWLGAGKRISMEEIL